MWIDSRNIPRLRSTSNFAFASALNLGSTLANVMTRFGERLRAIRLEKGLSQEKVADLAGLHRNYVSSVERGERNISIVNIDKLAQALKVPMAELMS